MDQPAGTGTKLEEQTSEELTQAPHLSTSYAHREISHDNWKLAQLSRITQQQKSFTSEVNFYAFVVRGLIPTGSGRTKYEHIIIPSRWERKGPISERSRQKPAWCCMAEWPRSSLAFSQRLSVLTSTSAYCRLSSPDCLQQRGLPYPLLQTLCNDVEAGCVRRGIRLLSASHTKHSVVRKDVIRAKEAVVLVPIKSHIKKNILDGFPMSTRLGSANLFIRNLTVWTLLSQPPSLSFLYIPIYFGRLK